MTIQEKTNELYLEQIKNWPLLRENVEGLQKAQLKSFQFDGFCINIQFNPQRLTSASAKVDKKSIAERPCFLCSKNRPTEQNEVPFHRDYEILCNPFPIFREHYTIAHKQHLPQKIKNTFGDFLDLAQCTPKLVTLYNGANCGASAPDHLHFQAGNRGLLPLEDELTALKLKYGKNIPSTTVQITAINDTLRRFLVLESANKTTLENAFKTIYMHLSEQNMSQKPMLNLLSWFQNEKWHVMIFPRDKHRPWQYFEEGTRNILVSPGLMELAGVLITPLKKDFDKITKDDVTDILNLVTIEPKKFNDLYNYLLKTLK
jgi:ATP adenylyltransferase/5',5'''-P-1,P-4-tetraphosphate phosphorylase II